jgi:GT2 family glycosyltransferase
LNKYKSGRVDPLELRAALACLAEAGLLVREELNPEIAENNVSPMSSATVSVVIVNYESQEWLSECLPSVLAQSARPAEALVVDNASRQDPADWVHDKFPQVRLLRLPRMQSLAAAINRGVEATSGSYILVLNPDVRLEIEAIAEMLSVAEADPDCAAVAPKLKFWWAPEFLNGIGNQPGFFRWGADNGLGHLDLGQFDHWEQVPSACFAAALIRRSAWQAVGPCDEGFRFYYEDSDWSYRARLLGWRVRTAPKAVVYHAFGRRVHTGKETDLTPAKLRSVTYGRLRFVGKIATGASLFSQLFVALVHDAGRALLILLQGDWRGSGAILRGWIDFLISLPELRQARRQIQERRVKSPAVLCSSQPQIPPPLIWRGLPMLTWEGVRRYYLPAICAGKTRALPEFADL